MSSVFYSPLMRVENFFLEIKQHINAYGGFGDQVNISNITIMNIPVVTFSMLAITTIVLATMIVYESNNTTATMYGGNLHKNKRQL